MARVILITVLAVLAFAVILITRLPASWVIPAPPAKIACVTTDGSIWNGTCDGLTVQGKPFGDVSWVMQATALLKGKIAAQVTVTGAAGSGQAIVESNFSGTVLTGRNVRASIPLNPALFSQLPPNVHGNAQAALALARVENGILTSLQGHVEALNLGDPSGEYGSYSVTFPGGSGEPTGRLRDLGGPLAVEGTVRLTREPGFDVQGLVRARPGAPADLARDLQYLGSPDAQGRRPFAFAATF